MLKFGMFTGLLFWVLLAFAEQAEPIVIIVHKLNPTDNLTHSELRRLYSGKRQRWVDGQKVMILDRPVESRIRESFYGVILGEDPGKVFYKSGSPAPFRSMVRKSEASVKRFVNRFPNAIGYIYRSAIDDSVKVLTVDGMDPYDNAYILR